MGPQPWTDQVFATEPCHRSGIDRTEGTRGGEERAPDTRLER
jgi:hypothetical protein